MAVGKKVAGSIADPFAALSAPAAVERARAAQVRKAPEVPVEQSVPASVRERVENALVAGKDVWTFQATPSVEVAKALESSMRLYAEWRSAGRLTVRVKEAEGGIRFKAYPYTKPNRGGKEE